MSCETLLNRWDIFRVPAKKARSRAEQQPRWIRRRNTFLHSTVARYIARCIVRCIVHAPRRLASFSRVSWNSRRRDATVRSVGRALLPSSMQRRCNAVRARRGDVAWRNRISSRIGDTAKSKSHGLVLSCRTRCRASFRTSLACAMCVSREIRHFAKATRAF